MPGQGLLYRQEVWVGCHYRVAFGGSAGNTCDTYVSSQNALLSQALASVCSSFLSVRSFGSRSLGLCLPWPLTAADACLSLSMRRGRRGPGGTGERHGRVPGEPVCSLGDGAPPAQRPAQPRPDPRSQGPAATGGPEAEGAAVPAHAHPRRQVGPRLPSGTRGWVVGPWCWALLGRPPLSLCPAGPLGVGPGTQFSSDHFYEHLFCARSVVCAKTPSKNITVLLAQWYPTLCHPMDYNPSGSSVHGILQVRILEQVATSFSRGSSPSRN